MMKMEERLDKLLIQRQLISSRVRAEKIIIESGVLVNGKLITKPGKKIPTDATIELLEEETFDGIRSNSFSNLTI